MANPPQPARIGPNPLWVNITGAIFGGVTLFGFFVFAYWTDKNPSFVCSAFLPIAVIFSLGAALSAGFIGGAAAINGSFGPAGQNNVLAFSAGGGIAVLFIALYVMNAYFKEDACKGLRKEVLVLEQKVAAQTTDLSERQRAIDELKIEKEKLTGQLYAKQYLLQDPRDPNLLKKSNSQLEEYIKRAEQGEFGRTDYLAVGYFYRGLNSWVSGNADEALSWLNKGKNKFSNSDQIYIYQLFVSTSKATVIDRYLPAQNVFGTTISFLSKTPQPTADQSADLISTLRPLN